jgi:hypothetical protein
MMHHTKTSAPADVFCVDRFTYGRFALSGADAPFLCFAQTVPFIHDKIPKNVFKSKPQKQRCNKNSSK